MKRTVSAFLVNTMTAFDECNEDYEERLRGCYGLSHTTLLEVITTTASLQSEYPEVITTTAYRKANTLSETTRLLLCKATTAVTQHRMHNL